MRKSLFDAECLGEEIVAREWMTALLAGALRPLLVDGRSVVCKAESRAAPGASMPSWLCRALIYSGAAAAGGSEGSSFKLSSSTPPVQWFCGCPGRSGGPAWIKGFGVAPVDLGFDRQGRITVFAALLLALITLLSSYTHVDLLGAASVD